MILQDLNRKAPETTVKWIKEVDGGQVNFIHFELNVQCVSGPVSFNKFDLTLFLRADAVSTVEQASSLTKLLHLLSKEKIIRILETRKQNPHGIGGFEVLDAAAFQRCLEF